MPPIRGRPHLTRNRPDPLDFQRPRPPRFGTMVKGTELGLRFKATYRSPTPEFMCEPGPSIHRPIDPRPPPIRLSDMECIKSLGAGAAGEVLLVRMRRATHPLDKPGSLFAIKYFTRKAARNAEQHNTTEKDCERSVLAELPWNPFVAGVVDAFRDKLNLYLLMELAPCGTLRSVIQKRAPLDSSTTAFYFSNLVAGISFLQERDLLHRDLKPENILVGADGYLVIADFGTAAREGDETDWVLVGSPAYMAPELVSNDGQSEITYAAVDWWSAGVILFEMLTRKLPFHGTEHDCQQQAASGRIPWRKDVKMGKHLKSLISGLLTVDACKRLGYITWEEVKNHEWLKQVKWSSIEERKYLAPLVPKEPHVAETWHANPLPDQKKLPGLNVLIPPPYLSYNDCFPPKQGSKSEPKHPAE
ncbi:hypothetical protein D9615_004098 [Tricholomella constricta]|uniref:cAMP-dependent protein kinase n=1 Tax=Tricholomella constricta TaxID=117010 RepID=A0A8H5HD02_9AGAR|nr:hypothetical protein D9615_004098 [Tricholomella constricta]